MGGISPHAPVTSKKFVPGSGGGFSCEPALYPSWLMLLALGLPTWTVKSVLRSPDTRTGHLHPSTTTYLLGKSSSAIGVWARGRDLPGRSFVTCASNGSTPWSPRREAADLRRALRALRAWCVVETSQSRRDQTVGSKVELELVGSRSKDLDDEVHLLPLGTVLESNVSMKLQFRIIF